MKFMAVAIIFFTLGALIASGQRIEPSPSGDTDRINFTEVSLYIDAEADEIYYELTGQHFAEIGNIYSRCTMAIYDTSELEVNILNFSIEISDEAAMIYLVRMNGTEEEYTVVDQFQQSGVVGGQLQLTQGYDVGIIVFYFDMCQVIIESIAFYG